MKNPDPRAEELSSQGVSPGVSFKRMPLLFYRSHPRLLSKGKTQSPLLSSKERT